jgi:cellulose synthase (UDP-forming)
VPRIANLSAIAVTLAAWTAAVLHVLSVVDLTLDHQSIVSTAAFAYLVLISTLVAGSLAYLLARYGYARRLSARRPASDAELDAFRMAPVPSVTILVPSYKEDPAVVEKTLLSAALQDYPRRSVVLLIDDPPVATTYEDARSLDCMRQLADAVEQRLAAMQARISAVVTAF